MKTLLAPQLKKLFRLFFLISLMSAPLYGFAEGEFDVPDPDFSAQNTEVPIDGGLSLLLAAGVGYGVKKARDARKERISEV